MSNQAVSILVVDDEDLIRNTHGLMLEGCGYEVLYAENGKQALTTLNDKTDDICVVVTDVKMPEMDGYELCRQIRDDVRWQDLPVLFVTALDTLEEKLCGYEAGGTDYIIKPLIADELKNKVSTLLKIREQSLELKQRLQESTQAAMQAMSYSADLGQILEFYKNSLSAPDFASIASLLFEVTNAYGLKCVLQIYAPAKVETFAHAGQASPLEMNVMELARGKARFLDFGARTIINYQDFSLLVKNMPLEDRERYGTLKDSLGNLCNAIEARVSLLINDDAQARNQQVLSTIRSALDEIGQDFARVQKENITAIEDMMTDIDQAFLRLGLSEKQEEDIHAITRTCLEKTHQNYYKGIAVNERFDAIHKRLKAILGEKL